MPRLLDLTPDPESGIGRALIALLVLGFLSLTATIGAAAWVNGRNEVHTGAVQHTYRVEIEVADTRRLIEQGETTRRGYLLTPQPSFLTAYREVTEALPAAIARLDRLTADNPAQRRNLATLKQQIAALQQQRDASVAMVATGRREQALGQFARELGARPMRAIRATFDAMTAEEHRLLRERDADQKGSVRAFYAILLIAGGLLLFVALATFVTVWRYTRDLGRSRDRLSAANETLEQAVTERTADLTRANEEIQRFAYIVSHDLRSPLVNVMGFTAELEAATTTLGDLIERVEREAPGAITEDDRLAAREDLPEAIGFIRTSTQKMDRLINAILKLSREGRRVIAPERLDVARIVDTIRASLAHRLDDEGTEIAVEAIPPVTSDRLALEQILSNLIENAVKYLQRGRPGRIVVRGHETLGRVAIEVQDNGRGIAPADHQRVFDLFRRAGTQDQPGEGIGLAHVRALAQRLGGTIDMRSELGQGTTFTLTLPRVYAEQEART